MTVFVPSDTWVRMKDFSGCWEGERKYTGTHLRLLGLRCMDQQGNSQRRFLFVGVDCVQDGSEADVIDYECVGACGEWC